MSLRQELQQIASKARKERQDVSSYSTLVKRPAFGDFSLPANGYLFLKSDADQDSGTLGVTIKTRNIHVPQIAKGQATPIGWFERGSPVQIEIGFELLIDTSFNKLQQIATTEVDEAAQYMAYEYTIPFTLSLSDQLVRVVNTGYPSISQ